MYNLNIQSLPISFPFIPYPQQNELITVLIKAVQNNQNALIESPTGTGKTLCLLCSLLAWKVAYDEWRKAIRSQSDNLELHQLQLLHQRAFGSGVPFLKNRDSERAMPKIYYASRTHSQLSQVVSEIKNTAYSPKTSVLGSRDQLCVKNTVKMAPTNAKTSQCKSLVKKNQCEYYIGSESLAAQRDMKENIRDIEELIVFGESKKACPFYLTRNAQEDADIIFLPYNYLIDSKARKAQNINTDNAIIIFDEGHNVESSCMDATSFEFTITDLERAIKELEVCIATLTSLGVDLEGGLKVLDFQHMILMIKKLINMIKSLPLSKDKLDLIKTGDYIYKIFDEIDVTIENSSDIIFKIDSAVDIVSNSGGIRNQSRFGLTLLSDAMKIVFQSPLTAERSLAKFYKVHVQKRDVILTVYSKNGQSIPSASQELFFSFWCFSAAVAMKDLESEGCRTIILASGTLSPLDGFAKEMGIPFPHRLENSHVIQSNQILVSVMNKGPSATKLISTFQNRNSMEYVIDLGNSIANICRIVPGGVLCFFTSYGLLAKSIDIWKKQQPSRGGKTIWERISLLKKPFTEPKSKTEFGEIMTMYDKEIIDGRGAIFFAVCRGKASEGLDFSDEKARAVIICGIPYPALKEPKV
ncbi:hypothetical protein BC833DRAFT_608282 [Globomyces pollinis-pini]|nr:hypothetical protein BC833DRAFT_608282 [Globomyces pollinis-pini]